jgi:hypothetical protein
MVSKVAHSTERVNMIKDFKVLLASKGLIVLCRTQLTPYSAVISDAHLFVFLYMYSFCLVYYEAVSAPNEIMHLKNILVARFQKSTRYSNRPINTKSLPYLSKPYM